jgi:chorismate mutase/prephenate dehydratase
MGLDEWRSRIDRVDRQLLELLSERARLALEVGRAKRLAEAPVWVPEREHEVVERLVALSAPPLAPAAVRAIWREILSASRVLQRPFRVGYLGPTATYSHLAALQQFGSSSEYLPARGIPEVFVDVEREATDVGVVPVENSTEGAVNHTLDSLIESPLLICGEIHLEIQHFLLSRASDLAAVRRVYSHPQAFAQCRHWLERNLPGVDTVEMPSTAGAVEHARAEPTAAAIASAAASRLYDVPVLRPRIEDSVHNVTRFLVMGRKGTGPTGRDKTSILVSIKDEVGALHRIIEPFAAERVNLTRIESRPTRQRPWEYVFFMDFEGHQDDPPLRRLLEALRERCLFVKVLGSYPAAA